jgi:hypothetical protein
MIPHHNTPQNTARIARTAGNTAVRGDKVRSVLTTIIARAGSFVARNPPIATAYRTHQTLGLCGYFVPHPTLAVDAVGILDSFTDGLSSLSVYPSARATVMHQVNQQELDRAAYTLAKDFLLQSGAGKGVTPELIGKYLHFSAPRSDTLAGLYEHILESAQSANMKAGVIGGSIGGVGNLGRVLCDFEPSQVLEKYQSDWEAVLDDVVAELKPRGTIRRTPRSIWPRYCRTILSSAKFLVQFDSANYFFTFVDFFDKDERARAALPLLLEKEIEGFGFALACDFVMGLGYENFSKPDVHIKDIFQGLGLCPWGSSDYEVFKAVARVARNAGVTPYSVDRLFWLIGSGYLHGEPHIGNEGKIRGRKKAFIEAARAKLDSLRGVESPHTP